MYIDNAADVVQGDCSSQMSVRLGSLARVFHLSQHAHARLLLTKYSYYNVVLVRDLSLCLDFSIPPPITIIV